MQDTLISIQGGSELKRNILSWEQSHKIPLSGWQDFPLQRQTGRIPLLPIVFSQEAEGNLSVRLSHSPTSHFPILWHLCWLHETSDHHQITGSQLTNIDGYARHMQQNYSNQNYRILATIQRKTLENVQPLGEHTTSYLIWWTYREVFNRWD